MEEQLLTRYERKQLKRQEKQGQQENVEKAKALKRIAVWTILALFIGGTGYGVSRTIFSQKPTSSDLSQAIPFEGQTHVSEGTPVEYRSNPPTSGNHWPDPLKDGLYDVQKPDEAAVHSLEHGRIWISYKPSISAPAIQALNELLSGQQAVIFTPREKNDTDIALAAWMRLDTFNLSPEGSVDTERILTFIKNYRGKGPENIPMQGGGGKEY
ncbi:MAG: DUF3105 domain-containing protein [bacterium]|nr:DUF3105 domain-containing protein [bacterium]